MLGYGSGHSLGFFFAYGGHYGNYFSVLGAKYCAHSFGGWYLQLEYGCFFGRHYGYSAFFYFLLSYGYQCGGMFYGKHGLGFGYAYACGFGFS